MKKLNTSTRFLIAHVFLCSVFVASVTTAQAQVTPQPEEGAINTSRSNIKNTSRAARGSFGPLVLDLYKKGSGQKIASHKLVDSDGDGTLSELEGAFAFRNLPEGERSHLSAKSSPQTHGGTEGHREKLKKNYYPLVQDLR